MSVANILEDANVAVIPAGSVLRSPTAPNPGVGTFTFPGGAPGYVDVLVDGIQASDFILVGSRGGGAGNTQGAYDIWVSTEITPGVGFRAKSIYQSGVPNLLNVATYSFVVFVG